MQKKELKDSFSTTIKNASRAISEIRQKDYQPTMVVIKEGSSHTVVKVIDAAGKSLAKAYSS